MIPGDFGLRRGRRTQLPQHAESQTNAVHVWDAKTDTGVVREHNEDCFAVEPECGLFVVCDGMGGHARGEVASSMACNTIRRVVIAAPRSTRMDATRDVLVQAIRTANGHVLRLGTGEKRPGTTVAAILWAGDRAVVAHVGDSRVYRLRRGTLAQLTRDHSLANELVDRGVLKPEKVAEFPQRNVLTRALGTHDEVKVDVQAWGVLPGDVFLLASDGLEVLQAEEIRECLALEPSEATEALIARTVRKGAPDNVTVVVVRTGGAE